MLNFAGFCQVDTMTQDTRFARLRYTSRRGMLELDVLLIPFLDEQYAELSEAEIAAYEAFLEEPDPDLFAWLMGYQACENEAYRELIARIRRRIPA